MKIIAVQLNILYVDSGNTIKLSVQKVQSCRCRIISSAEDSPRSKKSLCMVEVS